MRVQIQLQHRTKVIHTEEIEVYPICECRRIFGIDLTAAIERLLLTQRQDLLPPEGHTNNVDQGPHPG